MASKAVGKASLRAALKALNRPKRNKFNARKHICDGLTFDSGKERDRYLELKLLTKAGTIGAVACHVPFELFVNGIRIGKYTPDFVYSDCGQAVAEDVKSRATKTTAYRLRVKLFKALYPQYTFRET